MARSVLPFAVIVGLLAILPGCGFFGWQQRPAWRDAAEKECIARKAVRASAYVQPAREISGPGICGLTRPLKVTGLTGGTVAFNTQAVLGCPVTEALESWLEAVVQPAALARFGQPVTQIDSMGLQLPPDQQCARRQALRTFLRQCARHRRVSPRRRAQDRSCGRLDTRRGAGKGVPARNPCGCLRAFHHRAGPGSNALHYDHFHVDLAMHGATSTGPRRYCRPIIKDIKPAPRRDDLPDPPMLEPELEIARAKMRGGKTLAETALAQNQQRILTASLSATPGAYSRSGSGFGSSLSLGAPPQMLRAPAVRGGMLRDDGAFVPPGEIGD